MASQSIYFIESDFYYLTKILRFIHAVACISRLFLVLVKLIMERKKKKGGEKERDAHRKRNNF